MSDAEGADATARLDAGHMQEGEAQRLRVNPSSACAYNHGYIISVAVQPVMRQTTSTTNSSSSTNALPTTPGPSFPNLVTASS